MGRRDRVVPTISRIGRRLHPQHHPSFHQSHSCHKVICTKLFAYVRRSPSNTKKETMVWADQSNWRVRGLACGEPRLTEHPMKAPVILQIALPPAKSRLVRVIV